MRSQGRGRRWWSRVVVSGAVAAMLAALLVACGEPDPREAAPGLASAWTADIDLGYGSLETQVTTEDLWIFHDLKVGQLAAIRLADGTGAWHLPFERLCEVSAVNDAGLLAVRHGSSAAAGCGTVTLLDTRTGKERWSVTMRSPGYRPEGDGSLALTGSTVAATAECGVQRWSVAEAKSLDPVGTAERKDGYACTDATLVDTVVLMEETKGVGGYDVDTGERRWVTAGTSPSVAGVYAADPAIVDIGLDGAAGPRTVALDSGEIGPVIGRPVYSGVRRSTHTVSGEQVVGTYDTIGSRLSETYESTLRGWDPATGKELWSEVRSDGEDFLGADETGVYIGRPVRLDERTSGYWVLRKAPDESSFRSLGWVEGGALTTARVGDLLLVSGWFGEFPDGSRKVRAFRLPEASVEAEVPPVRTSSVEPAWAEGEVRPDPRVDPCAAVGAETLGALGLGELGSQQAPLGCEWVQDRRALTVRARIHEGSSEGQTATEQAETVLKQMLSAGAQAERIDGLGDEAWGVRNRALGGPVTNGFDLYRPTDPVSATTLLVRRKNVVVEVSSSIKVYSDDRSTFPVSYSRTEAALVQAAREVLAEAGAEEKATTDPGTDGPVTSVGDPCAVIDKQVRAKVAESSLRELAAPGETRLRGCRWTRPAGDYFSGYLQVVVYAAGPSAFSGASGTEEAEALFEQTRSVVATPVPAKAWDEAARLSEFSPGSAELEYLIARKGNVVILVQAEMEGGEKPTGQRFVRDITERILAEIHG